MKQGDFSQLAKSYVHRTGYSLSVLEALFRYARLKPNETVTADVGAGTGKLTENLIELGFKGFAIEPCNEMRSEGIKLLSNHPFQWLEGTAEKTNLSKDSVDWVLMGSSFHWADPQQALKEFHRILRPNGFFVALWNPRDIESSPFHLEIEQWIDNQIPDLKRISSGNHHHTKELHKTLVRGGYFKNPLFMETSYSVRMPKERYLGAWQSVNDIQAQAGEKKFQEILGYIESKIGDRQWIEVPYKTRAWIVQVCSL